MAKSRSLYRAVTTLSFSLLLGACADCLGLLASCLPICFQIEVVLATFLDTHVVGLGEAAYLGLAQTIELHDVEAGIPELLPRSAKPLVLCGYRCINGGAGKALCAVGLDGWDVVVHPDGVEAAVAHVELPAHLGQGVTTLIALLTLYKGGLHALLGCAGGSPLAAAMSVLVSLLLGNFLNGLGCRGVVVSVRDKRVVFNHSKEVFFCYKGNMIRKPGGA